MEEKFLIDRAQIPTPQISITQEAFQQLSLIWENDVTLKGKYFRLLISGKGCDGFTYSVGFTDWQDDDFLVQLQSENKDDDSFKSNDLAVVLDPFTAFYLQKGTIDYLQDFTNNNEGFTIENHNQKEFAGKFWRKDETKIPPANS